LKVIIIAAGVGSRLGDLTKNLPKPLLDVNGKSILEHQFLFYFILDCKPTRFHI
jgi:MurNAc alpha-1-phosphate uridylyltransferase